MDLLGKKISFIIPAYNEAGSVAEIVESVKKLPLDGEIIVIDDGSTDQTAKQAEAAGAKVISHQVNRGYGASIKTGINTASHKILAFIDADVQQEADDFLEMSRFIDEYDMVVGARVTQSHSPLWRKPGKKLIEMLANYLAGHKIPDLNSGLRLVKRDAIKPYLNIFPDGYSFSTTSTIFFLKEGLLIKYVPITVKKRVGKSALKIHHGFDTIILVLRLITLFEPLKIFLPASLIIFLVGLVWAVREFILFHSFGATSIILGITSLLVFFVGLISDQIASLRKELK